MAGKSPDSLSSKIECVYAYYGADDAQKRAALEQLAAELLDPDFRDFDFETLSGPDLTADRLFTASGVAPLASKRRLVVITRADDIPTAEQQAIASRLGRVPESACIVFVTPAPEMQSGKPKRKDELHPDLMKAVRSFGKAVDFPLMKDQPAAQFVQNMLREAGKAISPAAAAAVVRRCGTDSGILASETAKLAAFAGSRKTVTDADVEQVTTETVEERIFALMDAVGSRNAALALHHLRPLLHGANETEKEALRTLVMLARHFRQLWQARVLIDGGCKAIAPGRVPQHLEAILPEENILKARDWQQRKYLAQAKNFTLDELARCFERIAAADLAIKGMEGGITDPAMALQVLIIDLSTSRTKLGTNNSRPNTAISDW